MKRILTRTALVFVAGFSLCSCVGVVQENPGIAMEMADERAARQLNKAYHEMKQGRYYYARELTRPLLEHKTAGREAKLMMKQIEFNIKYRNIRREQELSAKIAINDVEKRLLMPDNYDKKRLYVPKVGPFIVERGPAEELLNKPVDVNLNNADIPGVLEALRQVEGLNFIADEGIEAANTLTIQLNQVPLRDILGYIERNMGLKFYVTKDVVWVMSPNEGEEATKGPRLETKIIHLKKGYIPQGGSGGSSGGGGRTSSSRSNSRSGRRTASTNPNSGNPLLKRVAETGGLGDLFGGAIPNLGGGNLPDISDLGDLLKNPNGGNRRSGGGNRRSGGNNNRSGGGNGLQGDDLQEALDAFFADSEVPRPVGAKFQIFRNRNVLIIRDTRENIRLAQELIEAFDRDPMQVIIETRFVTVGQTDFFKLGAEINQATKADRDFPDYTDPDDIANFFQGGDGVKGTRAGSILGMDNAIGNLRFAGILDNWLYDVTLSILSQMDTAQTLEAPRVTVVNNRPAHIRRGKTYRYFEQFDSGNTEPVYDANGNVIGSEATLVPTGTPSEIQQGLTLDVTPSVGNDGKSIGLSISLQNIQVDDFQTSVTANGEYNLPNPSETEIETSVVVGNGETVVMGGTVSHKIFDKESKIPLLGDIPLIGFLFRRTERTREPEHLLIFVTANVLDIDGRHKLAIEKEQAAREAALRLKEANMVPEELLREDLETSDLKKAAEILRKNGISPENILKEEPKKESPAAPKDDAPKTTLPKSGATSTKDVAPVVVPVKPVN